MCCNVGEQDFLAHPPVGKLASEQVCFFCRLRAQEAGRLLWEAGGYLYLPCSVQMTLRSHSALPYILSPERRFHLRHKPNPHPAKSIGVGDTGGKRSETCCYIRPSHITKLRSLWRCCHDVTIRAQRASIDWAGFKDDTDTLAYVILARR